MDMIVVDISNREEIDRLVDFLDTLRYGNVYHVSVAIDDEGVKFKANNYSWSPGYGVPRNG